MLVNLFMYLFIYLFIRRWCILTDRIQNNVSFYKVWAQDNIHNVNM